MALNDPATKLANKISDIVESKINKKTKKSSITGIYSARSRRACDVSTVICAQNGSKISDIFDPLNKLRRPALSLE